MSTDYKCCLCQVVSANCTRKCIICASGEKRICNSCLARNNKCLECRGGDGTVLMKDNEKPSNKQSIKERNRQKKSKIQRLQLTLLLPVQLHKSKKQFRRRQ
jgi:hypothetical protein